MKPNKESVEAPVKVSMSFVKNKFLLILCKLMNELKV